MGERSAELPVTDTKRPTWKFVASPSRPPAAAAEQQGRDHRVDPVAAVENPALVGVRKHFGQRDRSVLGKHRAHRHALAANLIRRQHAVAPAAVTRSSWTATAAASSSSGTGCWVRFSVSCSGRTTGSPSLSTPSASGRCRPTNISRSHSTSVAPRAGPTGSAMRSARRDGNPRRARPKACPRIGSRDVTVFSPELVSCQRVS